MAVFHDQVETVSDRDYPVNQLLGCLLGGLASDRVTPLSDVDIAVYVLTGSDFNEYKLELFDRLTQVLGTAELDLIILNTAPLSLTGRIQQSKKVLVDKDPLDGTSTSRLRSGSFLTFGSKKTRFFR